ncbi:M14 family metallopeptidase [candidate division KSB1 bacterium]
MPISFNDFHGYTGAVSYIKSVAEAYPDITELIEFGKSNLGRPMYVLAISNMSNGSTIDFHIPLRNKRKEGGQNVGKKKSYEGKPGYWIDGALHGNEYTGSEVCLYIINKLVSGYGTDKEITRLIDSKTFYICPASNPDGLFSSVEMDIPQRQNSMLIDDDGDGYVNEDPPDDLNKDGHITQFRFIDPDGSYVIDDIDPRIMVRLGRNEITSKIRYSVVKEDRDNDGDGRRGEDGARGIDLNRNFSQGWFKNNSEQGGSGYYPMSSPEARAIAEFFYNHENIHSAQNYHTSGGFTYRPPSTVRDDKMHPKDVAVYDLILGKKYLELIGDELPGAWKNPEKIEEYREALKGTSADQYALQRGYEMPRGWVYNRDGVLAHGTICDWMHLQYGAYAVTTELWNSRKDMIGIPVFSGDGAAIQRERALLKYQDEQFGSKYFIPWNEYKHPDLGEGEIGGWIPKYSAGNNAFPGESLKGVCETHWKFELFRAGLLPEVVITDIQTNTLYTTDDAHQTSVSKEGSSVSINKKDKKGKYKVIEVTAIVENRGKLASHTAHSISLANNREDVVWLTGERDKINYIQGEALQKIGVLEGSMVIPGYNTSQVRQDASSGSFSGQTEKYQGNRRTVRWIIALEGNSSLKVIISSQKGGTAIKEIEIK